MKRAIVGGLAALFAVSYAAHGVFAAPKADRPAFPGATGFGVHAVGGATPGSSSTEPRIVRVTSLEDRGEGTLRACIELSGPRTCIFEVAGRIHLSKPLSVSEPFLTVAGQTAPPPGVTITGAGIRLAASNVVIRHLAIRVGDDPKGPNPISRDGVVIDGSKGPASAIVLDHLSISWALDENFSTYGPGVHDVTLSNSILAEGLYRSIHPDGPHSMGILIGEGTQRITITGCLLAHNNDRNPRQKAGSSLEFASNLVYGWGGLSGAHGANLSDTSSSDAPTLLNFTGNYYLPAPYSPRRAPVYSKPSSSKLRVSVARNIGPTRPNEKESEWLIADIPETARSAEPAFPGSGMKAEDPLQSFEGVLKLAGSRPLERDEVDRRIVEDVRNTSGSLRDRVDRWPDFVEQRRALKTPPTPFADTDRNGYTDLEDWLECYARSVTDDPHADCEIKTTRK